MLAITSLILRPQLDKIEKLEVAKVERPKTLRYEVLIPYTDPVEANIRGFPTDARLALIVEVWATSVEMAKQCSIERFRDHRARARTARLAPEGPIALRTLRSED